MLSNFQFKGKKGKERPSVTGKSIRGFPKLKKVTYITTTIYITWQFSNTVSFQNRAGENAATNEETFNFFL